MKQLFCLSVGHPITVQPTSRFKKKISRGGGGFMPLKVAATDAMLFNPIASTILKLKTFRVWGGCGASSSDKSGGPLKFKIRILFYGDNFSVPMTKTN
jgi:hypothetical protein